MGKNNFLVNTSSKEIVFSSPVCLGIWIKKNFKKRCGCKNSFAHCFVDNASFFNDQNPAVGEGGLPMKVYYSILICSRFCWPTLGHERFNSAPTVCQMSFPACKVTAGQSRLQTNGVFHWKLRASQCTHFHTTIGIHTGQIPL